MIIYILSCFPQPAITDTYISDNFFPVLIMALKMIFLYSYYTDFWTAYLTVVQMSYKHIYGYNFEFVLDGNRYRFSLGCYMYNHVILSYYLVS